MMMPELCILGPSSVPGSNTKQAKKCLKLGKMQALQVGTSIMCGDPEQRPEGTKGQWQRVEMLIHNQ